MKNIKNPLNLDEKEFKFVKNLIWDDVWEIWRRNEADLPHWIEYVAEKGFDNWAEWRQTFVDKFNYDKENWFLYEVLDSVDTIPEMRGGPYKSWREKYYGDEDLSTFSKVLRESNIKNDEVFLVIENMMKKFPSPTVFIGLSTEKGIVIIEGMHRGVALAFAKERNYSLKSESFIALAEYPFQPLLDSREEQLKPKT